MLLCYDNSCDAILLATNFSRVGSAEGNSPVRIHDNKFLCTNSSFDNRGMGDYGKDLQESRRGKISGNRRNIRRRWEIFDEVVQCLWYGASNINRDERYHAMSILLVDSNKGCG